MRTADLLQWYGSLPETVEWDLYAGPDKPDTPSRYILITLLPGAGLDIEDIIDRPAYQIAVIGEQGDREDAERAALSIDQATLRGPFPVPIGETSALIITRTGGRPSPLATDNADRTTFVCTYIAQIPSGL